MSMPDYPLGETLDFKFTTRSFSTGVPTQLAGTPVIDVYEDNSITQITTSETLTVDFDGVTGLNNLRIVATSGNGYESGKSYAAVITTGTVGGVSVVGEVVAQFSIERSPALRPTTAGRTLDVAATGEAGVDFGNVTGTLTNANVAAFDASERIDVGSWLGTAVTVSATTAKPEVDVNSISDDATAANNTELFFDGTGYAAANSTIGTCTTNTDMRGTDNAALASVCTEARLAELDAANLPTTTDAIETDTQDIQSRLPAALVGGRMDSDVEAINNNTAAADNLQAHALTAVSVTFSAGGTTTTAVLNQVDGAAASATNDVYNGRVLIFTAPAALKYQATDITDYDGGTTTATITAVTTGPDATATAILV